MAALASLMCEYDHAAVCVVPSHGPAPPFVEGALARTVAFRAFDGGRGQVAQLLAEMYVFCVRFQLSMGRMSGELAT